MSEISYWCAAVADLEQKTRSVPTLLTPRWCHLLSSPNVARHVGITKEQTKAYKRRRDT